MQLLSESVPSDAPTGRASKSPVCLPTLFPPLSPHSHTFALQLLAQSSSSQRGKGVPGLHGVWKWGKHGRARARRSIECGCRVLRLTRTLPGLLVRGRGGVCVPVNRAVGTGPTAGVFFLFFVVRDHSRVFPMRPLVRPPPRPPPTDVVVVGGGVIGLYTSLTLLRRDRSLRVTLVEAERHPAGTPSEASPPPARARATGAGQGYLWLAHRPPETPGWRLAVESKGLWEADVGAAAWARAGYRQRGALLVTPHGDGFADAEITAAALRRAGCATAEAWSADRVATEEPTLATPASRRGRRLPHVRLPDRWTRRV